MFDQNDIVAGDMGWLFVDIFQELAMSNNWCRLWHEMPTDPKFRTVARVSGEDLSLVISLFVLLMVDASRNVTRGHVDVTVEDMASALDVTDAQVEAVLGAMEGRVIRNGVLTGWDSRQPKREDDGSHETGAKSAAERKRAQRERDREAQKSSSVTTCHDVSRNVTLDKDKDKDKEQGKPPFTPPRDMSQRVTENRDQTDDASPDGSADSEDPDSFPAEQERPKAKARASDSSRGSRLPDDWVLPKAWGEWAVAEAGWTADEIRREADRFHDHWKAQSGQRGRKADWQSTWRNWIRKAADDRRARTSGRPSAATPENKQEALEARNRMVAKQWVPPEIRDPAPANDSEINIWEVVG